MIAGFAGCVLRAAALVCLVLIARTQVPSEPPTPRELYASGVEHYREQDYSGARACWTQALEHPAGLDAPGRAQCCKGLGNIAFRQDRPLEAAAWFTAAIELAPRDGEAWSNLELARSKAGIEPADRGDLGATLQRVLHALSLAEAEWLALCVALALALGIVLRALVFGRAATRWLGLAAALGAFALLPWIVRLREQGQDPLFVVSSAGAPVLSEPRSQASKLALLPAGARALRLESVAGWVRVQTQQGSRGWVSSESVFALRR